MKKLLPLSVFKILSVLFLLVSTTPSVWAIATFQQYTQAVGLYRSGQYAQAYQQFSGLMKAHPEDVRLPYYLGLTAVRLGKIDQAKQYYETVLTIAPNSLVAPYAKQGLALLQESIKLDAPPSPLPSAVTLKAIENPTLAKHNTLVAQWQKTHPVVMKPLLQPKSVPIDEKPMLPAAEPVGIVSTLPTATNTTPKEISISPAMLAVSATGSAGLASTAPPAVVQTPEQLQLQQQQQMMQTMMMMQLMGGSGGGGNAGGGSGGGNSNPMAMMLPMMMMQQQQQQNPANGGAATGGVNPFSGIDPKMMSDMMTQGMMNNLDLFSDSKKDN